MKRPSEQIGVGGLVLNERERELVGQVLASNRLSYGPVSQEFERKFSELHGCEFSMFCNSGTAALHLAFTALRERYGWGEDAEVILPATTFVSSLNAALQSGLKPVLVDVQADTFNIDPEKIEERISDDTCAILPVHLLGLPADMTPILNLAERNDLRVVEDSAESMFARYKDRPVGSMGHVGCFSTYVAHLITTGVGGLVTTQDPILADMIRSLIQHGRDNRYLSIDDDSIIDSEALWEVVQSRYRFNRIGFSYRITELEAAIGLGQLENWEPFLMRRREIAGYYKNILAPFADRIRVQQTPDDRTHAYMVFGCVCIHEGESQRLVHYLENHNIETRPLFPLANQPAYKGLSFIKAHTPIANNLSRNGFYIGCHPYLSDSEVEYVTDTMLSYFRENPVNE